MQNGYWIWIASQTRHIWCSAAPLGDAEIEAARAELDWPHAAFEILPIYWPSGVLLVHNTMALVVFGKNSMTHPKVAQFDAAMRGDVPDEFAPAILDWKTTLAADPQKIATRVASQKTLEVIVTACPTLFGGSADLTGSNNTMVVNHSIFDRDNFNGTYVHYGVREHGMVNAMNGIALHGGAIP